MADTPRDLTALLALLADNTSGDISPQDLRDFVVSVLGEYAEIYVHDGSTAQTSITTTPTLLTGFASNGPDNGACVADAANDRITLGTAGDYEVSAQFSFSGTLSTTFTLHARLDAVEVAQIACTRKLGTGGDVGSCSFTGILTSTAGQQLTVYVESDAGGGASMTLIQGQLVAKRVK